MAEASEVGRQAVALVTGYLQRDPTTIRVDNVEEDDEYQVQDVDLLWSRHGKAVTRIEVKGDRQRYTGNYFFETISNQGKLDPGCFIYTEAEIFAYCFVPEKELHLLPMPATRRWLLRHWDDYATLPTSTPSRTGGVYRTLGKPVPRRAVLSDVVGWKVVDLQTGREKSWVELFGS